MKTELFYFSGTGNSIYLARQLADELKGAKISSIIKSLDTGKTKSEADIIGIITPVHFMAPPNLVKEFARKLQVKKDAFIFSIANCGLMDGNTNSIISQKLNLSGKNLNASYTVFMPDNSIAFPTPLKLHKGMLKKSRIRIKQISKEVKELKNNKTKWLNPAISAFALVSKAYIVHNVKKQQSTDKCNNCNICFKTCPVHNIKIKNNKIIFGNKCQMCFACIQSCPSEAIEFGALKINKTVQYFNPETTTKDIAKQRA